MWHEFKGDDTLRTLDGNIFCNVCGKQRPDHSNLEIIKLGVIVHNSSSVQSFAYYDYGQLIIKYSNNWEYAYHGVPQEVVAGLFSCDSVGKYVAEHIKSKYKTERIV